MDKNSISNIIIAEDSGTLCATLKESLVKRNFNIIGTAANGQEVLALLPDNKVDLVLMDVHMPIMDGIEATECISKNHPLVKVLMLSNYNHVVYVQESIDVGAKGYILKDTHPQEIADAINTVIDGGNYFSPTIYNKLAKKIRSSNETRPIKLAPKEKKILNMLRQGCTSDEVSVKMNLSLHTIKAYRKNMFIKFSAKNVAHLIAIAFEKGHLGNKAKFNLEHL
ncbi:MAG: response regulator transcription factor [Cyclobacteriaceae bacterium]|nr:response regulator transcription factor [Cyclobacteriaceae bacterium]